MLLFFNPYIFVLWVLLSWIVGMLGRERRFGFFGNFLVSLLFSPLVGVIVLLASDEKAQPPRRPSQR